MNIFLKLIALTLTLLMEMYNLWMSLVINSTLSPSKFISQYEYALPAFV